MVNNPSIGLMLLDSWGFFRPDSIVPGTSKYVTKKQHSQNHFLPAPQWDCRQHTGPHGDHQPEGWVHGPGGRLTVAMNLGGQEVTTTTTTTTTTTVQTSSIHIHSEIGGKTKEIPPKHWGQLLRKHLKWMTRFMMSLGHW